MEGHNELKDINYKIDEYLEMKLLRKEKIADINNSMISSYQLKETGNCYELILEFEKFGADDIEIKMAASENEYSLFKLDFNNLEGILDNSNMKDGMASIRKFKISDDLTKKIHIFMNKSVIEIYLKDRKEVLVSRVYPQEGSEDLIISSQGGEILVKSLDIYSLLGITFSN